MGTSLIRGKYIICQITNRTTAEVIVDGAVVQRDGVIIDVGPYQDMASRYQPDDELGSAEHIVMPGLVNRTSITGTRSGRSDFASLPGRGDACVVFLCLTGSKPACL